MVGFGGSGHTDSRSLFVAGFRPAGRKPTTKDENIPCCRRLKAVYRGCQVGLKTSAIESNLSTSEPAPMILCVNANAAIDKTAIVSPFRLNAIHRPREVLAL